MGNQTAKLTTYFMIVDSATNTAPVEQYPDIV